MAIQNASDLLVYAKTANPAKQVTRIRVLTTDPISVPDGGTTGTVKINNATNVNGQVYDAVTTAACTNTGNDVIAKIVGQLSTSYSYTNNGTTLTDGDYSYRDFTNGANGIVPTLELVNGTATFNEGAVIIEIITLGSSAIFDPVAFSTSASFSTNMDLRDVTNKDSGGWSESLGGLRSFEVSTDILQSINPDVPLDGTDFFDKLKNRSLVDLSFSDRIRNIIRTNLTQSGVDGFSSTSGTQTNLQTDPFSGSTASKFLTAASTSNKYISYTIDATRVENKKVNWSFYVKGSGSTTQASFALSNSTIGASASVTKIEGQGTIAYITGSYYKITGLSTSDWTRISFQTDTISLSGSSSLSFYLYPGLYSAQDSDEIFLSSWQIELSPEASDYQDPTDITHWQGNALVSSLSFDAGVEDNLTCSATFTGTGNVYPNGLGPELIGDTGFNDPSYWALDNSGTGAASVIQDGYGKIITTSGLTAIKKDLGLYSTPGDFFSLTYTVHTSTAGGLSIHDGWDQSSGTMDVNIPSSVGTHTVLLKPGQDTLFIKRQLSESTTIWLSSISLKKVL